MLIENRSSVNSAAAVASRVPPLPPDERARSTGNDSLAISPEAGFLHAAIVKLARRLYFDHRKVEEVSRFSSSSLFPAVVDIAYFAPSAPAEEESPERDRLEAKLFAAFDGDPLEDGIEHPAERIIAAALHNQESSTIQNTLRSFSLDKEKPAFAASVLRCLGRQTTPGTSSWRVNLMRDALTIEDIQIRDAAVQAAELWGDNALSETLESHIETEPWLRDYIVEVVESLHR